MQHKTWEYWAEKEKKKWQNGAAERIVISDNIPEVTNEAEVGTFLSISERCTHLT